MVVAIVKRSDEKDALRKAIALCNGFEKLKKDQKILIKPNLVCGASQKTLPPFGIVTTARIIEELVRLLQDKGCRDITIGEGSIIIEELRCNTIEAFKFSGIDRVAKQYGINLVDFNKEAFEEVELDGCKCKISKRALESDFIINVPVLKTQFEVKASLGLKNLKGCLKLSSKRHFHSINLEKYIALLNNRLHSNLTIIDGTYALERGPVLGLAYRKDLIIASTDILSADMVGASILGIPPSSIGYIMEFAKLKNRSVDINSIEIKGANINEIRDNIQWEYDPFLPFKNFNITGIRVSCSEQPQGLCSGCLSVYELAHYMFSKDNPGIDLGDVEVCVGPRVKGNPKANKVILFGRCAIKSNKNLNNAIEVKGCPPKITDYLPLLMKVTLDKKRLIKLMSSRIIKQIGFLCRIYNEDFGLWEQYSYPEFDINHFK